MKKTTKALLNVSIVLIFLCSIIAMSFLIKDLVNYVEMKNFAKKDITLPDLVNENVSNEDYSRYLILNEFNSKIQKFDELIVSNSIIISLTLLAAIASVIVFVYCNPKIFRRSAYDNFAADWKQNHAERAERNKQKRIEQLQAELEELEELKKDE